MYIFLHSFFRHCVQLYDSEFHTEVALTLKAYNADNANECISISRCSSVHDCKALQEMP